MAVKTEGKTSGTVGIVLGVVAVGVGLLFMMKGQKQNTIAVKAHYSFGYKGPAQTLATGVRFGDYNSVINLFNSRSDWVFCKKGLSLPSSPNNFTTVEDDMIVNIANEKPDYSSPFQPPYSYDAEFSVRKADCSDIYGPLLDQMGKTRDIQYNVLTQTETPEIVMGGSL